MEDLLHRNPGNAPHRFTTPLYSTSIPWAPTPQDVYVEDLLHRNPGDASTLAPTEAAFAPLVKAWVAAEPGAHGAAARGLALGAAEPGARDGAGGAAEGPADPEGAAAGGSFTRVVVSSLKPEILRQIADEEGGQQLCRYFPFVLKQLRGLTNGGFQCCGCINRLC